MDATGKRLPLQQSLAGHSREPPLSPSIGMTWASRDSVLT